MQATSSWASRKNELEKDKKQYMDRKNEEKKMMKYAPLGQSYSESLEQRVETTLESYT